MPAPRKKTVRKIRVATNCEFCKGNAQPSYQDVVSMTKYMNERGRIVGRDRTGVCAKHQRHLSVAIKRARHLGLMPFVGGL